MTADAQPPRTARSLLLLVACGACRSWSCWSLLPTFVETYQTAACSPTG